MRKGLLFLMLGMTALSASAQRHTDRLDRGLVAVKTNSGVFCSWRIPAGEYYDVTYNIYRDGQQLNSVPLTVSNYTDKSGTSDSKYSVQAVVRGKAQEKSPQVTPWAKNYLEVKMDHGTLKSTYVPNDACVADVDGDGEMEILLKFDNASDHDNGFKPEGYNGEYAIMEIYKLNGKKLWWIELGPNMTDFQNNENNIVAFDWDQDGKAEAVIRAADGTVIHKADGSTVVIGDKSKNYRPAGGMSGQFFIHEGAEYLLYLNGATGDVYQQMEYPLKRLEDGETDLNKAWGDGYGHRSTKHFFGAPFLDGKKPSIFLARGIYTQHKMVAFDVDPATHQLKERWRWNCKQPGSPWYGQGYHNFGIADVDWDGRDEIVYGSMVIDDNGHGLSTTGLGHGDSQHCGDFDPYTPGQEIFACNEDRPGNNLRDATTSKIYYRYTAGNDDGRCLMGNFVDDIPGAVGVSSRDPNLIGAASHKAVEGDSKSTVTITQNFRIYWDGDLCEESFNYENGKNTAGAIYKARKGKIAVLEGSMTNNDTKGTPDFQGDILGDWREEVIMRTADNNIRIYTTTDETPWRNYTLWHDHQYRNSMVWQMCGYNQTPHVSYYLGEMEGITVAPPPLTLDGRTEVASGSTISAALNDEHLLLDDNGDMTVAVADGAKPYILTDNAPVWTQGHDDNNNITTDIYTHTLTGGAFTGGMRLVKQGGGVLVLPKVVETYTGPTQVWGGTLRFDGTLQNSRLWLNRHTTLESDGGKFLKGIEAGYNATIYPGGKDRQGTLETDSLILNFGSRLTFDLYGEGTRADMVKANVLKIGTVDWKNGPTYSTPVINLVSHPAKGEELVAAGKYLLGEFGKVDGDIARLKIEGLNQQKTALSLEDGKLYLTVTNYEPGKVTWTGAENGEWDVDETKNFVDTDTREVSPFVPLDDVIFDDTAVNTDVVTVGHHRPKSITFNNETKNYTLSGDSIVGSPVLVKNGNADVTVNSVNRMGAVTVNGGSLTVGSLANTIGVDYGALGDAGNVITVNNNARLVFNDNLTTSQTIKAGKDGAGIETVSGKTAILESAIKADDAATAVLTKTGGGTLRLGADNQLARIIIKAGTVEAVESNNLVQAAPTVEFVNGTFSDPNTEGSYTTNNINFVVGANCYGTLIADPRCNYTGKLTGSGTFNVFAAGIRNTFGGDWSAFEGTIVPGYKKRGTYAPSFDFTSAKGFPKATLKMNEGVTFNNSGNDVELAKVTGNGTIAGAGRYIINAADNFSYSTPSKSAIVKRGEGRMTITQGGKIENNLTIEEGELSLNMLSSATKLNYAYSTTVTGNARISGKGYLNSLLLKDKAVLDLSSTANAQSPAKMKLDGMLNAAGSTTTRFVLKKGSGSTLEVGTYLYLGTVEVALADGYTPKAGDSFTLWTASKLMQAPVAVNLPELPAGLFWDQSGLKEATGVLRVTDVSGIDGVTTAGSVRYDVYTTGGVKVGVVTAAAGRLEEAVARLAGQSGTYLLKSAAGVRKITVK